MRPTEGLLRGNGGGLVVSMRDIEYGTKSSFGGGRGVFTTNSFPVGAFRGKIPSAVSERKSKDHPVDRRPTDIRDGGSKRHVFTVHGLGSLVIMDASTITLALEDTDGTQGRPGIGSCLSKLGHRSGFGRAAVALCKERTLTKLSLEWWCFHGG